MSQAIDDRGNLRHRLTQAQAHFLAGLIGDASKIYRAIIEEKPDQPDALHMLGVIAYQMGKIELALQLFDEALRAAPQYAQAWSNRALILRVLKRTDEALQSAHKAIACDPKFADGWDVAGLLLRERQDYKAACQNHAQAVQLSPNNYNAQNNYAVALLATGQLADAYRAARKAIEINPSFAAAYLTAANILNEAGWPARAVTFYQKAYTLDPNLTEAIASEGRSLILMGEIEQGWPKMEKRSLDKKRFESIPVWQGRKTGHLLLYGEQGAGDIVQFLRYIPMIRDRADKITLEIPASMQRLIAAQMPELNLVTAADPLPETDAFALLMSLPYICKTRPETIPAAIPYIYAEEAWRAPWRKRLESLSKPLIGAAWMGNPLYGKDYNRSLGLDDINPLFQTARPHLVSLQKGKVTATSTQAAIFDAEPWLDDFASTTGLIAELDLVITADTGIAHIAGAMGKPVWIMLPFAPDWRWMQEREDSPWYPRARLFRQRAPKEWGPVVTRICDELRKFIAGDSSVLIPPAWNGKIARHNPDAIALPDEPFT